MINRPFLLAALLVATQAWAADWDEKWFNPKPAEGDFTLPIPCGGKITFRAVKVPLTATSLSDRAITLGEPNTRLGYLDFNTAISSPHRSRPAMRRRNTRWAIQSHSRPICGDHQAGLSGAVAGGPVADDRGLLGRRGDGVGQVEQLVAGQREGSAAQARPAKAISSAARGRCRKDRKRISRRARG
jgi:hypothetical protein